MQHWAGDSPGCFLVSAIVFDIDRCRGSILFTDAVHAGRIAIGCKVFFENLWPKGTAPEGILEDGLGSAEQIEEDRDKARQVLKAHNGHFINFDGRWTMEYMNP